MEKRLAIVLSASWFISAYSKISTTPTGLKEQTLHFTSNSAVPVIPDIFSWAATSSPELWVAFSTLGFVANALLLLPKKTRLLGVIGSMLANALIYSVSYSGGIPVLTTNFIMFGVALVIGLGILEES